MSKEKIVVEGITLAVFDMESMRRFYEGVFSITFVPVTMFGSTLYRARLGELSLLLCPAEIAGNDSKQNRHQLEILIGNLEDAVKRANEHGGQTMGEISSVDGRRELGVYDPDRNSIVLVDNPS